jgi:hypothetical protein
MTRKPVTPATKKAEAAWREANLADAKKKIADMRASVDPTHKARTLTLRLQDAPYRRLRNFVTTNEQKTGERLTHQEIIETALAEYLSRNGG